jgi:hypothetical protein
MKHRKLASNKKADKKSSKQLKKEKIINELKRNAAKKIPIRENALTKLFPVNGKVLLTGGGKQFVERIGVETIRKAVYSVMLGENLRSQTEHLSRRRIAQISGALLAMVTQGYLTIDKFQEKMSSLALNQIENSKRSDTSQVWPAQWLLGLTGKSVQNVLRSDKKEFIDYVKEFDKAIIEAAHHCKEQIGDYSMTLGYVLDGKGKSVKLDWEGITRLTTAIGAQTLTIRGSDKSMYGKLFERLILGSFLTMLGFKRVDPKNNIETKNVFWLSDSTDNRESDATLLIEAGKIARFDIGFIGPGNSEISKDKLSRFSREMEIGGAKNSSTTFIIVDRLPQTSKTIDAARKIGAEIVQMSMQYWPQQLCKLLFKHFKFKHDLQKVDEKDLSAYLKKLIQPLPIQDFLSGVTLDEIEKENDSI